MHDCTINKWNKDFQVCHKEPILLYDKNIDQRIKSTLGITG